MDDKAEWAETNRAMDIMNFTKEEKDSLFRITAGIMQLGNIKFENVKDCANVVNKDVIGRIGALLKVDPRTLETALIKPRIKAGTEIVQRHLSAEKADDSRNALAKMLYNKERAIFVLVCGLFIDIFSSFVTFAIFLMIFDDFLMIF